MNTNFDFGSLKNKVKWKRAFAFFLSATLLLTSIAIPNSLLETYMTVHASASGDAEVDPRGEYYKKSSFPISYLEQEEIHEITTEGKLGAINDLTWYQFTPTETAAYTFQSSAPADNNTPIYGAVFTKNIEKRKYIKIKSRTVKGGGFQIKETLEAGITYYLCAGYYKYPASEYEVSFFKNSIVSATEKINGVRRNSLVTAAGKSYVLEADVLCTSGVTPTYQWYTLDENEQKQTLSTAGSKYTYTATKVSPNLREIFCTITTGTESETLCFTLFWHKIRFLGFTIDGNCYDYSTLKYQMNQTYTLKADAISTTARPLTYTWKKDDTILQSGANNTLLLTPIPETPEYGGYLTISCEISDDEGSTVSDTLNFIYQPIANAKGQVNGEYVQNYDNVYVSRGIPYTLNVSATAEPGKTLEYQWFDSRDGSFLGNGPSYQYIMHSENSSDEIYCVISDDSYSDFYYFNFTYKPITDKSLTVNGSSASGNAIPVHIGETYQFKVAAKAAQNKMLSYQWGTMENGKFTALSGISGDTFICRITKAEDILQKLVCQITDSDGNTVQQKCYMRYKAIYNVEPSINGIPMQALDTRPGQKYSLAVKATGEQGKKLTYSWSVNNTAIPNENTSTYSYTAGNGYDELTCTISDGTNTCKSKFYMDSSNAIAYDFTINGISTNVSYAYEGKKVVLELKDKYYMAEDTEWEWNSGTSSGTEKYKKQITLTMGKEILEGKCAWNSWYEAYSFLLIPCTSHSYAAKSARPATASTNGAITSVCSKCGHTRTAAIAKISNVKLSKSSLDYNGKNQNVALTVSDRTGRQLKAGTDYDYTFNNKKNGAISAKNVGQYTVKLIFKGNYNGTKNLTFTILPQKITLSKVSAAKKGFRAVWKKSKSKVTGYEISYSTNKSFKKKSTQTVSVKGYKKTTRSVQKLKAKKIYYVKVRAYQNIKVGKKTVKLYGKWSSVKKVKTRK